VGAPIAVAVARSRIRVPTLSLGTVDAHAEGNLSHRATGLDSGVDNGPMHKDIDLLPWILGALATAIVAAAIAVGTTHHPAATLTQTPQQAAAPLSPAVVTIEPPPPASPLEPAAASEPVQPVTAPPEQSGQIWECTTNGQKTFSSKPCGDKATLLDVGPVNTMNATPIGQPSRNYPADTNYAPDYSYPGPEESPDNSYPAVIGIPYAVRMRPERTHHPFVRDHGAVPNHGPPPRKN
jgi:hypothetical protein